MLANFPKKCWYKGQVDKMKVIFFIHIHNCLLFTEKILETSALANHSHFSVFGNGKLGKQFSNGKF
jgi:hypothetical protein